ncbi:MAG: hypothetical protein RMK45_03960 [Armatimonadota bacterium]|nr:hypothetical protein [Armatimonadota bacterium]
MTDQRSFLDDPNPEGRAPMPEDCLPAVIDILEQTAPVLAVLAFKVHAEGVMRSDATLGVWLDEALTHEDKIETLRQLAARLAPLISPNYYLDLMLISPRDRALWQMATEHGDLIFARDEQTLQAQVALIQTLPPFNEDERDIDVMRVM